ncbi:MAG TPA: hypothetical protein VMU82_00710 [Acetobacteraceae bacterium]|nr:hypothetical protein [Acetobacteraceae bacterium]
MPAARSAGWRAAGRPESGVRPSGFAVGCAALAALFWALEKAKNR